MNKDKQVAINAALVAGEEGWAEQQIKLMTMPVATPVEAPDYLAKLGTLPPYMQGGMLRYIEKGIPPGSFLTAVLSNDLKEAVGRADAVNIRALHKYIIYLYNYVPRGCWGSPSAYVEWVEDGGLAGREGR